MKKRVIILALFMVLCSVFNFAAQANASFERTETLDKQIVYFRSTSPMNITRFLVLGFLEGTTDGFDYGYDATVFAGDVLSNDTYFLVNDLRLVINAYGTFDVEREIPLLIKISEAYDGGLQTFGIWKQDNFADERRIFLRDKETGIYHDLEQGDVAINLPAGEHTNRFSIVFQEPLEEIVEDTSDDLVIEDADKNEIALSNTEFERDEVLVFPINNGEMLKIKAPEDISLNQLTIYNSTSEKVYEIALNNTSELIDINLPTGVYYSNLNTETGNIFTKIFIQ